MDWYANIKLCYGWGVWTKSMVADGVKTNHITAEQYKEITGDDYPEPTTETTPEVKATEQEVRIYGGYKRRLRSTGSWT